MCLKKSAANQCRDNRDVSTQNSEVDVNDATLDSAVLHMDAIDCWEKFGFEFEFYTKHQVQQLCVHLQLQTKALRRNKKDQFAVLFFLLFRR